jgi:hypothetical protein
MPFPVPGTSIAASAVGTTGAIVATLAAVANQTTYLTGFAVTFNNPTAAVDATVTVAGVVGGPLVYGVHGLAAAATVPQPPPLIIELEWPIPATAVNVAITVTLSALGAGGIGQVNAHGFQL